MKRCHRAGSGLHVRRRNETRDNDGGLRMENEWGERWSVKMQRSSAAREELLNGVFWSLEWDRNSGLLAERNECALTNTETKGDEWVSTGYRLPSDTAACVCCLIYAGLCWDSFAKPIVANNGPREHIAWLRKRRFKGWHPNLWKWQSVAIRVPLNWFTGIAV